ncbi:MAG: helix-turn-helix domain-containing protein [Solirubrobacteraceae bacterium]
MLVSWTQLGFHEMAEEAYLTVLDIAELLKVNQQTVRNWIDRGELPAVRAGARRIRIRQTDLDAFIEKNSTSREPATEQAEEQAIEAWKTFATAMAKTTAKMQTNRRSDLIDTLRELADATRDLVGVLEEDEHAAPLAEAKAKQSG